MKIVDNRAKSNTVIFKKLKLGELFQDENGYICIKISQVCNNGTHNVLYIDMSNEWHTDHISENDYVIPLKAEIVIS